PLTDKSFKQEVDMPGHFTVEKGFTVGLEKDGEIKPYSKYLDYKYAPAGDVNKDNFIDIHDALYIQKHWKTDKREADINFDGVVDEEDMQYVIDNYLMKNPWMKGDDLNPEEEYNGITLEDILRDLDMVENIPPNLEVESPSDNMVTNKEVIKVKGTVTDDDFDKLLVDDKEINVNDDDAFATKVILNEGENEITITATDLAGNETTVVRKVTLHSEKPEISKLKPSDDMYVNSGDKVHISFHGPEDGKGSFLISLPSLNKTSDKNVFNMKETDPGVYEGAWEVPADMNVNGADIKVEFEDEAGNGTTQYAKGKLFIFKESTNRIAGDIRYDTAIETSKTGWTKSDTIILARG